jgi:hypothetical protein
VLFLSLNLFELLDILADFGVLSLFST